MVLNTTFNNISVISWWSVLLVEETGGPGENHWPVTSHSSQTIDGELRHFQQCFSYIVQIIEQKKYHMFITKINFILDDIHG
jgi:hypothetical protein